MTPKSHSVIGGYNREPTHETPADTENLSDALNLVAWAGRIQSETIVFPGLTARLRMVNP
jgi:hypothetical protein